VKGAGVLGQSPIDVITRSARCRASLLFCLAKLEAEIVQMRTEQLSVSYQEGKIVEGTRHRCLVTVAVARKLVARILHKDPLRLKVQLAVSLVAVNDEVDRFVSLLANQVSTQEQESLQRGVEWATTLERICKGDGDRRVVMLSYVLARVASVDRTTEK